MGLFDNMANLWEYAQKSGYDYFMWMCDDDEILDENFLKEAKYTFEIHENCAVVGYKCDRYLNNSYWYSYEDISTLDLSRNQRFSLMTEYMRNSPNSFETLQYGIHKLALCPEDFTISYRKSIITFFVIISTYCTVHTIGKKRSIKHTTDKNLESYASGKSNKILPILFRYLPLGFFVRIRILYHIARKGEWSILPYSIFKLFL